MKFTVTADVEIGRIQGKFATRDEIGDVIREEVEQALSNMDLSSLGPDSNSEYEVQDSNVEIGP